MVGAVDHQAIIGDNLTIEKMRQWMAVLVDQR